MGCCKVVGLSHGFSQHLYVVPVWDNPGGITANFEAAEAIGSTDIILKGRFRLTVGLVPSCPVRRLPHGIPYGMPHGMSHGI